MQDNNIRVISKLDYHTQIIVVVKEIGESFLTFIFL